MPRAWISLSIPIQTTMKLPCNLCHGHGYVLNKDIPLDERIRDRVRRDIPMGDRAAWIVCPDCGGIGSYEEKDGEIG